MPGNRGLCAKSPSFPNGTEQSTGECLALWWLFHFLLFVSFNCFICCCSVAQLCLQLHNPMESSTPGFPALDYLPEFAQTPVHCVGDAIQPSHPLLSPSPPALNLSQHQGLSSELALHIR